MAVHRRYISAGRLTAFPVEIASLQAFIQFLWDETYPVWEKVLPGWYLEELFQVYFPVREFLLLEWTPVCFASLWLGEFKQQFPLCLLQTGGLWSGEVWGVFPHISAPPNNGGAELSCYCPLWTFLTSGDTLSGKGQGSVVLHLPSGWKPALKMNRCSYPIV